MSNLPTTQKTQLPAHLKALAGARDGFLEDESRILTPPRLKLIQAQNKTVLPDGLAQIGDIWSEARYRVIGGKGKEIPFIPLVSTDGYVAFAQDYTLLWKTRSEEEAGKLCKGMIKYGKPAQPFQFYSMEFLVIIEGVPEILTVHGSSIRTAGKPFYSQASKMGVPLYAQNWLLDSKPEIGTNGDRFWVYSCIFKDFVSKDDLVMSQTFFEKFKAVFEQRQEEQQPEAEKPKDMETPF